MDIECVPTDHTPRRHVALYVHILNPGHGSGYDQLLEIECGRRSNDLVVRAPESLVNVNI
jgi:hypothetical protein